jgi:ATP-dependent helicase/nuclease subunit A
MTMLLSDSPARERAATSDDRNIVVNAGAGTGKTTLLVNRLLHLLLHRAEPLAIGDMVALTFTNKAADEMKLRLRMRLNEFPANDLAAKALHELEKSQIGTIHSFAAHLLRLYPIESRVDPGFQQDEGRQFDAFFQQEWALWLDQELGAAGAHDEIWTAALSLVTLEELQELARGFAGELIPLDEPLDSALDLDRMSPLIREWLLRQADIAGELRKRHPKTNILERMLEDAAAYLERIVRQERCTAPESLNRDVPPATTQWERDDYEQARRIVRVAQAISAVRLDVLQPIVKLIVPFARECRRRFVLTGYVSFDGSVARACNLLRDHPLIRRELKRQFRSILVDEFQDTDPVQYEMILYLAEAPGLETSDWRKIRLEPGKLFIVGDPKQSIYAFRRADMEAYDTVVEDHVLAQSPPGERHTLHTNFRSHVGLLTVINAIFSRMFPQEGIKGIQPRHDPLLSSDTLVPLTGEQVEMRLVRSEELDADAETTGRAEAEELARWLSEEVFERQEITEHGVPVKIKPRHVAILFRTLTDMRDYLEALRRYHIPCLTEGEKHFYERQEVIDVINLLRAAMDPHDRPALVGVLRSSLGAMPDVQIEALTRNHVLDYRIARMPGSLDRQAQVAYEAVGPIYVLLRNLSVELPRLPLSDVLDTLLANAPLLELAAASIDGEQAVANVLKLRDLAVQLARQSTLSLRGLVCELTTRALEVPDEAESSLAEDLNGDGQGFVRLLSIHKAKGLEFPVVIVAGLQRSANHVPSRIMVHHDWSSGIVGIKVGDLQTVGAVYVSAKLEERRRAEQSRVLYVAMTRAKRRLILSAGMSKQAAQDSFLAMVAHGFGIDLKSLGDDGQTTIPIGSGTISLNIIVGKTVPLQANRREGAEWQDLDHDDVVAMRARWDERIRHQQEIRQCPPFLSPTLLKGTISGVTTMPRSRDKGRNSQAGAFIGTLAHRLLEQWNFADDSGKVIDRVASMCVELNSADTYDVIEISTVMREILEVFVKSEIYHTLRAATIVGREVPFAIPWHTSDPQHSALCTQHAISMMEGTIDLVYRLNGDIWIADYKTDRITSDEIAGRAEEYRLQAQIYTEAVSQCLGVKPKGFQFIFLRTGTVVPVLF